MFLTDDDYKKVIRGEVLNVILEDDNSIRTDAEIAAQSEMESYLNKHYDIEQIFAKAGTERNAFLVMMLVDMVLYHVHSRISPKMIPETRETRYESAIEWLTSVAKGQITAPLPKRVDDDGNKYYKTKIGGQPKQNWLY